MDDVKHTVEVSSNVATGCAHCDQLIDNGSVDDGINHYIQEHGYRLLHVGMQTSRDYDGNPWHSTVAVLGHNDPPAMRPPAEIVIGGLPPR
jgi:hypothetical protein